jgi:hypothetical protein
VTVRMGPFLSKASIGNTALSSYCV